LAADPWQIVERAALRLELRNCLDQRKVAEGRAAADARVRGVSVGTPTRRAPAQRPGARSPRAAGTQYGLTAPILWNHGVELWVPEVGGRVDPDSEAHDLVMSLFGGLSKAERARIQRRVRNAMQTMARAGGRYLGGRPPYGYRLVPVAPHPNAEKARVGATLNRLQPDPVTAPIVQRIFAERLAGAGYSAIARGLNTKGIPSPAQHDPQRNSHRNAPGWADSAVRAILRNARYTGHEVFGRQRRDYDLIDLSSPAEGHVRRMRWNDPSSWIWSPEPTHEALVSREDWTRAQGVNAPVKQRAPKATSRPYPLGGLVFCASCGRRMHGPDTRRNAPVLPLRRPQTLSRHRRRPRTRCTRGGAADHERARGMAQRVVRAREGSRDRARDRRGIGAGPRSKSTD
jgi:hypothetical protein